MTSLIRLQLPISIPLIRLTRWAAGGMCGAQVGQVLPQRLRGDGEDDDVRAVEGVRGIGGRAQPRIELDAGQVVGVLVALRDRLDEFWPAGKDDRLGLRVAQNLGERRAP